MPPVNVWLVIWAASQALAASVLLSMAATLYHDVQRPIADIGPRPVH